LHECADREQLRAELEKCTGVPVAQLLRDIVAPGTANAIFVVGSIPLGLATGGSDVDLIAVIDDKQRILPSAVHGRNTDVAFSYVNDADALLAGNFLRLHNGIQVDVTVAIWPSVCAVYERLRRPGPELAEQEIRVVSRLQTGWLLAASQPFEGADARLKAERVLDIHCSTRSFVFAVIYREKGIKALAAGQLDVATQYGRQAVEMACASYLASEGLSYLGDKWLAFLRRGSRTIKHSLPQSLRDNAAALLFPELKEESRRVESYHARVTGFLTEMRNVIVAKPVFRIAFQACALIDVYDLGGEASDRRS
jgi:hypothetical protein